MSFPYLVQDLCPFSAGPSLLLGLEDPPIACPISGPHSSPCFPDYSPSLVDSRNSNHNYLYTLGQKYKTTLKNEKQKMLFTIKDYKNQIYER